MHKVHLDTDLGGDIDDLCALAMLLRWPEAHITGITTTAESGGRRAGYVRYVLGLEGHTDVLVAAGADVSTGRYRYVELDYPVEQRYWPEPVTPAPGPLETALDLLERSIEQGAAIIAIGPYTNLHLLELRHPGILHDADIFLMGGFVHPIRAGFPAWGNEMDWNIQADVPSARHVIENSEPTLIPLTVTVETALRRMHLDHLKRAGSVGRLIARQAEAFAMDVQNGPKLGAVNDRLPDDLINFLHDPLACAIALGFREGIEIKHIPLRLEERDGWLYERADTSGRPIKVVTWVDGPRFSELWLGITTDSEYNRPQDEYRQRHNPRTVPDNRPQGSGRLPRTRR